MPVDAVENAFVGSQVKRSEREERRERRRIQFGMHFQKVIAEGQSAFVALFLLEERRLDVNELGLKDGLDFGFYFIKFRVALAVNSNIETDIKKFLLRLLELVAKILQVLISDIKHWVAHQSLFFPTVDLTLDFGYLSLELAQNF